MCRAVRRERRRLGGRGLLLDWGEGGEVSVCEWVVSFGFARCKALSPHLKTAILLPIMEESSLHVGTTLKRSHCRGALREGSSTIIAMEQGLLAANLHGRRRLGRLQHLYKMACFAVTLALSRCSARKPRMDGVTRDCHVFGTLPNHSIQ